MITGKRIAAICRSKKFVFLMLLITRYGPSEAQLQPLSPEARKQTFTYAVKDGEKLDLDIYTSGNLDSSDKKPCILFVFGGAFMAGRRDDSIYNNYFNALLSHRYIVISISYRLGLKGAGHLSKWNIQPLRKAIDMAVEDVYDATGWAIDHADNFGIDTAKIILSGSSSGAITALESDFDRRNHKDLARKLPGDFEYAGVIAFSGAILSFDGRLKYQMPPAPTLLFHGTADKIVPYHKIRFLNKGFYGSDWIAKTFKENGYPVYIYRIEGMGHEISVLPMIDRLAVILDFLDQIVINKKPYQIDLSFKDPGAKPLMTLTPKELFEKLKQKSTP